MLCFLGLRGIACTKGHCRSARAGASWLSLGYLQGFGVQLCCKSDPNTASFASLSLKILPNDH